MKIALIGATGFVGSRVLAEALSRNHELTAIVQHPEKLAAHPKLRPLKADATDPVQVEAAVRGSDAVISAYNPGWTNPDIFALHVKGSKAIQEGVRRSGVRRLLVVGGAGSLEVAPGVQLVDTPTFPAEYKQGALGAREALTLLRAEKELDWTFISPPAILEPGARTGKYRTGGDQLLMAGQVPARISVEDLAVAILDEIERPQHLRSRFTVAY
ncbi:MAG TPA: NAD(P)-dependent oxidoreductase [Anaeromyxobacteraceae bacterium]|nr:NAD(P)-dependent oxidoreductase [Anaeromyxobacteraceae bacterium]